MNTFWIGFIAIFLCGLLNGILKYYIDLNIFDVVVGLFSIFCFSVMFYMICKFVGSIIILF